VGGGGAIAGVTTKANNNKLHVLPPKVATCNTIYNALIFTLFGGSSSQTPSPSPCLRPFPSLSPLSLAPGPRRTPRPVATLMKTASDLTQIRVGWWKSGKIGLKRGERGLENGQRRTHDHDCTFIYRKRVAGGSFSRIGQYF